MDRNQLYNRIDVCGNIDYSGMVYLINSTSFDRESDRVLLLNRISQSGQLSSEDWKMYIRRANFTQGGSVTKDQALSWLEAKCSFNAIELKEVLESIVFLDGSQPTYLMGETGDILIKE